MELIKINPYYNEKISDRNNKKSQCSITHKVY